MTFDISQPANPKFEQYINNRDFSADPKQLPPVPPFDDTAFFVNCASGDLQAVKAVYVPQNQSPINEALLLVVNNFSGSVTSYRIQWSGGCQGAEFADQ